MSKDQEQRVEDLLLESESLEKFIINYIQRAKGSTLTIPQIQAHYAEYCDLKKWKPFQDKIFRKLLPDLMQEHHYASESHSIENNRNNCRGYRNVQLVHFQTGLNGIN